MGPELSFTGSPAPVGSADRVEQFLETAGVALLGLGQRLEPVGDLVEALVAGGLGHARVHVGVLVGLAGDGRGEVVHGVADGLVGGGVADSLEVVEVAVRVTGLVGSEMCIRDSGHLEYLEAVGDPATGLPIGGTGDNLKAAIAGETHEYTDMYPGMAKSARDEGFDEIADWFETLAKAERSHANRFQKALDGLED